MEQQISVTINITTPQRDSFTKMEYKDKVFIDGQFVSTVKGGTFTNYKPTTGEVLCEVAAATKEDVDLAVAAAKRCLNSSGMESLSG